MRVVSEVFRHMANTDRIALVYTELLRCLGTNPRVSQKGTTGSHPNTDIGATSVASSPPVRHKFKLASTYGSHVYKLPLFRYICSDSPLTLIIEALTPSQWKPDVYPPPLSERCGEAHTHL